MGCWVRCLHPCFNVLSGYLFDKRFDGEFYVVACLYNVDAIIKVKVALAFDWFRKLLVDEVHEHVRCFGVRDGDSEVVDLA